VECNTIIEGNKDNGWQNQTKEIKIMKGELDKGNKDNGWEN
jgi:hypothetical protein